MRVVGLAGELEAIEVGEVLGVEVGVVTFAGDDRADLLHLRAADGGLQIGHAEIEAHRAVHEFVLLAEGQGLEGTHLGGQRGVVGHAHAALAGGDDFVRVETEATDVAKGAGALAVELRAVRLGAVLDDAEVVRAGELQHRAHVDGMAEEVDDENGLGARRAETGELRGVEIEGVRLDVHGDGGRALVEHSEEGRHVRERGGEDFIAGTNAEGGEGDLEGGGAVADRDAVRATAEVGELAFEAADVFAKETGDGTGAHGLADEGVLARVQPRRGDGDALEGPKAGGSERLFATDFLVCDGVHGG